MAQCHADHTVHRSSVPLKHDRNGYSSCSHWGFERRALGFSYIPNVSLNHSLYLGPSFGTGSNLRLEITFVAQIIPGRRTWAVTAAAGFELFSKIGWPPRLRLTALLFEPPPGGIEPPLHLPALLFLLSVAELSNHFFEAARICVRLSEVAIFGFA